MGNSTGGESWGAKGTGALIMAGTAKHRCWDGRASYSRGPPGVGGRWAQDGQEGCLGQCSGDWVPIAGWAAKQGAVGEEGGRGVPAEGGGSKKGATWGAACEVGSSSMGWLAGGAAAGVGNGRAVIAPWGSGWQAAAASRS